MTITLQAVNELIQSLESAGELSIREQKFLKLAKAFKQLAAENVAMRETIEAVRGVADNSSGIAGWHLNGEIAQWSEILPEIDDIETPATDAYLAGIKADGAKAAGDYLKLEAQHMPVVERLMMQDAAEICYGTAARLREGADK
ncbi:hypothetical protein [Klebsiella pneumoniae]|uniref:hypothetical protein n=1 Tax=Klebsiella pneumoniae TaxID=573 RepID=UPI001D0F2DF8|nr:hypothetical protein [Klebsiella pneumoniae]